MPERGRRWWRVLPVCAAGVVLSAACSGPNVSGSGSTRAPVAAGTLHSVAVVTQSSPSDAFWSEVKNGALTAGKQLGVRVDYYTAEDPNEQAKLIDNAVAQGVDGLVVSAAFPDPLRASLERAVTAGIPVVTTVEHTSLDADAIGHIGTDERSTGLAVGRRLHDAGKTKLLCVNHMPGQTSGVEFCGGAAQGFGNTTTLQVNMDNPTDVESRIKGALQADPAIDAVYTLSGQIGILAVHAASDAHSGAAIATSTPNPEVINDIRAGKILFSTDPQEYEQGYLPVVMLQLYKMNLNTVAPVQPAVVFVDKSNVDAIAKLVARGTR